MPLVRRGWDSVCDRYSDIDPLRLRPELVRQQIGAMVTDVIAETRRRLDAASIASVADVRNYGSALCGFSEAMATEEKKLKTFMYASLYHHPSQKQAADVARSVVTALFSAYRDDVSRLPAEWLASCPNETVPQMRHIADFIAGMTDRYAVDRYRDHIGPIDLPEGF